MTVLRIEASVGLSRRLERERDGRQPESLAGPVMGLEFPNQFFVV